MLRAFWCWLEELEQQPLAGNLKKAVQYARKQQPYMENYLLDPRCQISNNLAENAIRPFTVGRCWRREIATIFCREYLTNFCRKSRSQQNK